MERRNNFMIFTRIDFFILELWIGTALLSIERRSRLLDLTVINFGLKWPMQPKSTSAWSPEIIVRYTIEIGIDGKYNSFFIRKWLNRLKWFLLVGESTSVTRLPSAKTAYPVTGACLAASPWVEEGIQVTSMVPSWGPPSTRTSIGGSGNANVRRG